MRSTSSIPTTDACARFRIWRSIQAVVHCRDRVD
jgi:hypothetical protein